MKNIRNYKNITTKEKIFRVAEKLSKSIYRSLDETPASKLVKRNSVDSLKLRNLPRSLSDHQIS